jgi:hypothetical protein
MLIFVICVYLKSSASRRVLHRVAPLYVPTSTCAATAAYAAVDAILRVSMSQAFWRHCRVQRQSLLSAGIPGGALHEKRVIVESLSKASLYRCYAGQDGPGCHQWFDVSFFSAKIHVLNTVNTTILTRSPRFRWPRTRAAYAASSLQLHDVLGMVIHDGVDQRMEQSLRQLKRLSTQRGSNTI